jgi:hypothetical protein
MKKRSLCFWKFLGELIVYMIYFYIWWLVLLVSSYVDVMDLTIFKTLFHLGLIGIYTHLLKYCSTGKRALTSYRLC